MKLANDITIDIGGEAITLRPCLRYAIRLERRPGGFPKLFADVSDDSYSAMLEIVIPHAVDKVTARQLAGADIAALRPQLLTYVAQCAGIDPDAPPAETVKPVSQKSVTFAEQMVDLYKIGTGWLGWTPADTLDATPAEIMEAYSGRLEMLRTIFGSGDDKPKADAPRTQDQLAAKFKFLMRPHAKKAEA